MKKIELTTEQLRDIARQIGDHVTENARAIAKVQGNIHDLLFVLEHQTAYAMDDSGRLKISFLDSAGRESMLTADDIVTGIKLQKTFPACFPDDPSETPDRTTTPAGPDLSGLSPIERLKKYHRQQQATKTR